MGQQKPHILHFSSTCSVTIDIIRQVATSCVGGRHNMPRPLQVDLTTLKLVSEPRVTWATSVPILVFLGLSVLDLGPMYTTDRQTCIIA